MESRYAFGAALALVVIVLLCLLYLLIAGTPRLAVNGWELPGNGSVDYMFIGSNDTLYAFRGNDIAAVRSDGSLAWSYTVPDSWSVLNNWSQAGSTIPSRPVLAESGGSLYIVAVKHLTDQDRDALNRSYMQAERLGGIGPRQRQRAPHEGHSGEGAGRRPGPRLRDQRGVSALRNRYHGPAVRWPLDVNQ